MSDLIGDPGYARRHLVPGLSGVKWTTEVPAEASRQAFSGRNATDGQATKMSILKEHRIGTWNVRGILQAGKLSIVEKEMKNHNLTILGICETHLQGAGHFNTAAGNTMYYSGNDKLSRNGVAIIVPPHLNKYVLGYNTISDRIITLKLNTNPCTLNIIQIYAPTAQASEDELTAFYDSLTDVLKTISSREMALLIGDWNAKVGEITTEQHNKNVVGRFGLGRQNERGEKLVEFGIEHKLTIANTLFEQHPRRRYTWKSPGDRYRNQIDYIIINGRWRSSIRKVKTFPGADCGTDHILLVAWIALRLKKPKKTALSLPRALDKSEISFLYKNMKEKLHEPKSTDTQTTPNILWTEFRKSLVATLNEIKNSRNHTASRKTWISDLTWQTVQMRKDLLAGKLHPHNDALTYASLSKQIQKECRRDKNAFIENICQEIEAHAVTYQTADLFRKVQLLSKKFKPKTWVIEDDDGNAIHDLDKVLERWRSYCEKLYQNSSTQITSFEWDDGHAEPSILRSEIELATRSLKTRKAPGADQISSEILKALGDIGITAIHRICDRIWQTCEWPVDWTTSVILPIHKKGSTKKCENYRTLSLISHASKVLLHVLNQRLRHFLDWQIPKEQAGFVKGRGTREQILNVRQLIEKCYEFDTPVVLCFVDYSKAFDCVDWQHLWRVLARLGVPQHLIAILHSLYKNSTGAVRINDSTSTPFSMGKGVRQGCILSPILFNIYGEFVMREVLSDWKGGVSIGGVKLTNLRYADDTTLIASSEDEMVALLRKLEANSNTLGLSINKSKTKIMVVDRSGRLEINGATGLEIVENFVYLGSNINNKGGCEAEVRRRIGMAKSAMAQLSKIWRDKNISQWTKVHLVHTLVFSIFLYGAETWTLKSTDRKRIDAFEMWCWRQMLDISWTEHKTNVSILNRLKIRLRLSNICLRRMLDYFGHIARKNTSSIEKLMITGKIEGKRPRGRSPRRWSDQIREALEMPFSNALRTATNKEKWRYTVKRMLSHRSHDPQR